MRLHIAGRQTRQPDANSRDVELQLCSFVTWRDRPRCLGDAQLQSVVIIGVGSGRKLRACFTEESSDNLASQQQIHTTEGCGPFSGVPDCILLPSRPS